MSNFKYIIAENIRNLYSDKVLDQEKISIWDYLRVKEAENENIEKAVAELYEFFPDNKRYIREIEEKLFDRPLSLAEKIEFLAPKKYNLNTINRISKEYSKLLPEHSEEEIKEYLLEIYKK